VAEAEAVEAELVVAEAEAVEEEVAEEATTPVQPPSTKDFVLHLKTMCSIMGRKALQTK
jgi:hypothetical protein